MSVFNHDVLPTAEEIETYLRNGWLLTQLFVKDECLEACRVAAEEVYAGQYDHVFPWSTAEGNVNFGRPYSDRTEVRYDAYVSHHKTAFRNVLLSPHLGKYAAALLSTDQVRLYRDMMLTMPGKRDHHSGWHVDKNYWLTASSEKLTTVWFSLTDCEEEHGCLVVVNASHAWRKAFFIRKIELHDLDRLAHLYGRAAEEIEVVPVPHKRGQISFHNCRLVHGSLPNRTAETRHSFVLTLQDGENHYIEPGPDERFRTAAFNTNDRIGPKDARGMPDYSDDGFYPALYGAGQQ